MKQRLLWILSHITTVKIGNVYQKVLSQNCIYARSRTDYVSDEKRVSGSTAVMLCILQLPEICLCTLVLWLCSQSIARSIAMSTAVPGHTEGICL